MTYLKHRKAVAPVIATLLLVAIAVVGGSLVFSFSQDFFSTAQISGVPTIESLKFTGYDASDGITLLNHDGTSYGADNDGNGSLVSGENVVIYVQSNSVGKITLNELRFGGTIYNYSSGGAVNDGEYGILTKGPNIILSATSGEVESGQQVSIILQLDENFKNGRDVQIKLTTGTGAVFVGTVIAGQTSG